jgi:hypothetical protein
MTRLLILFYLMYFVCIQIINVEAGYEFNINDQRTIRYYELNITQRHINPDCSDHGFPTLLINDQLPGPMLTANQGDTMRVLVRNLIDPKEHLDIAIHFHGIRQYGSVGSDGVPFLTQLPIRPGEEFLHEFQVVNQAGTYFYHAHVGLAEETVFGPLIIYESEKARPKAPENSFTEKTKSLSAGPFSYDEERVLLLSEWWHMPTLEFENYIMGPKFNFLPEADSILINGRTVYNPENAKAKYCTGYEVVRVQCKKTYRLRVIGATTFRTLGFAIAKHNLTIIEVDGELIKPYTVSSLEVTPGQRFSVLLHTDQEEDDYGIEVERRWSEDIPRATNGLAILQYIEDSSSRYKKSTENEHDVESRGIIRPRKPIVLEVPEKRPHFDSPETEEPFWHWPNMEPLYGVDPIVYKPASKTILLRTFDRRLPDGSVRWFVNDIAFSEEHIGAPILQQIKSNERPRQLRADMSASGFNSALGTYPIQHYDIVDIVIQTTHNPGQPCRSHPWHTHGHSHYEIAHGKGDYIEERDGLLRNVKTPIFKDVTMVYPIDDPELDHLNNGTRPIGCGWSKVRILAVSNKPLDHFLRVYI